MADAATVKAAYGVHAKGRPGKHLIDAWNAEHPDDPYAINGAADGNGSSPDYPDDDFDALFPGGNGTTVPDLDGDIPPETPPRKPRSTGTKSRTGGWNPFRGKLRTKGKRKPRVSTEELLGGLWRAGAKLAAPLPPLQRTLRVQAPVAGILLEDAVKDTVIDPLLQPLARVAHAGKTINALAGPPVWVTAVSLHVAQRGAQNLAPHPVFMAVAEEGLRSSLMAWMDVAGPKFAEAVKREQEFEEKYGRDVDDFMTWIFSPPVNPQDEAAMAAEEDAIRRAQGIL